jgi:hypothetical protein
MIKATQAVDDLQSSFSAPNTTPLPSLLLPN